MPTKIPESQLIPALARVFRTHGYEGASMTRISQATGLQKSSLYHRFPGGKQEMATAVARAIKDGVESEVLTPLLGSGSPKSRIRKAGQRLAAFYEDGSMPCILDTLSLSSDQSEDTHVQLRRSYDALIEGFMRVAIEAGLKPKTARQRATRTVVLIEGALIVCRVTGDASEFHRVIDEIPDHLTTP